MSWPGSTIDTTDLDAGTDSPQQARADLHAALQALNTVINARGAAEGVCELDASGRIPVSRGSFEANTRLPFYQPAAPTYWRQLTTLNDRMLRVVSGSGGGTGGSWSGYFGTTDAGGQHTHSVNIGGWGIAGSPPGPGTALQAGRLLVGSGTVETGETLESIRVAGAAKDTSGISAAHQHNLSAAGSWRPAYADVIICEPDL